MNALEPLPLNGSRALPIIGIWITPSGADLAEFSFMARNFREGVPGVRQAEVTIVRGGKAVKDALNEFPDTA
jgi:hypothetical protein